VAITDERTGAVVAGGSGSGAAVSFTWDGNGLDARPVDPAGQYVATLSAEGALPAHIELSAGAPPPPPIVDVTELTVEPTSLSPDGDGSADEARISFHLASPARVRVRLETETGQKAATILRERSFPAGPATVTFAGTTQKGAPLVDGRYVVVVVARGGGRSVARTAELVLDRTLSPLRVTPSRVSPNGDGRHDVLGVAFDLAREALVAVRVVRGTAIMASLAEGTLPAGAQTVTWDGTAGGTPAPDGLYEVLVEASSSLGTSRVAASVTVDTKPPSLVVLSASSRRGTTRVLLSLSERARVRLWTDTEAYGFDRRAGRSWIVAPGSTTRLRVRAWDGAGNRSRLVRVTPRR